MKYLTEPLCKYAVFRGRATRSQFWLFMLFVWVITSLAIWLTGGRNLDGSVSFIASLIGLFFALPTISITVRRLHDSDHSGWWCWISIVPLIGQIWLFILLVMPSTPGANRFGVAVR